MTFPTGGGRGAAVDDVAGAVDGFGFEVGFGVGADEGTVEDDRDHPAVLLGCGVAVSLVVTRRG